MKIDKDMQEMQQAALHSNPVRAMRARQATTRARTSPVRRIALHGADAPSLTDEHPATPGCACCRAVRRGRRRPGWRLR